MTLLLTMVLMGQCSNGQCSTPALRPVAQLEYRATYSAGACSSGTCSPAPTQQQTYSFSYTEQGVVPQERRGFFKKLFKRRNR